MYISLSTKFGDSQSKMRSSAQKSYISSGVPHHRWKSWMISSGASWAQSIARAILARDLVGWIESEQNHNQSLDSLDFFVGSLLCIRELTALSRKTRICYCVLDSLHCIAKPQSMLEGNNSALNARQLALRHLQSDFHCQCRRLQWSSASSTQWYEKRIHCIACKPHNPFTLSSFFHAVEWEMTMACQMNCSKKSSESNSCPGPDCLPASNQMEKRRVTMLQLTQSQTFWDGLFDSPTLLAKKRLNVQYIAVFILLICKNI